jgi:hypothetical protein
VKLQEGMVVGKHIGEDYLPFDPEGAKEKDSG